MTLRYNHKSSDYRQRHTSKVIDTLKESMISLRTSVTVSEREEKTIEKQPAISVTERESVSGGMIVTGFHLYQSPSRHKREIP